MKSPEKRTHAGETMKKSKCQKCGKTVDTRPVGNWPKVNLCKKCADKLARSR